MKTRALLDGDEPERPFGRPGTFDQLVELVLALTNLTRIQGETVAIQAARLDLQRRRLDAQAARIAAMEEGRD